MSNLDANLVFKNWEKAVNTLKSSAKPNNAEGFVYGNVTGENRFC